MGFEFESSLQGVHQVSGLRVWGFRTFSTFWSLLSLPFLEKHSKVLLMVLGSKIEAMATWV